MELTRKIIILENECDLILDYNYNYELMKEMYNAMKTSNDKKASKIHDEGFKIENKIYKLFTHQLFIENAKYTKEGIVINKKSKLKLTISGAETVVKEIALGIFKNKGIRLNNSKMVLKDIESNKRTVLDNISLYKVRTPIVAAIQDENRKIKYISPYEEGFFRVLANNLRRKYKLIYNKDYEGELFFDIEELFNVKKKFISNIKNDGFIIGYSDFELYIQSDKDMQKVAYYTGLGSNNSLGMGLVTHIMSRRD